MPSKSKAQHNFMAAVANNPSFAKKAGVPQSVGKEFNNADKGKTFKQGGDMKKMNMGGYADGGMPMKDGKPAFVGDGKGKMAKGGMAKKMAGGGMTAMGKVKTAAPSRDGVAVKGKTKGTMIKMSKGGKAC
jgi:hypothetical protein